MSYIPKEKIQALCAAFDGECGVFVAVPFAGEVFTLNADRKFSAASTIKIPLLALLFKDAEEGRIDLDALTSLGEEGAVRGSGIVKFFAPDLQLSLYDYATLMMIVSDNTATNRVIDAVGIKRANAFFAENGWSDTQLFKKLFVPTPDGDKGTAGTNTTSPRDLGDMMLKMHDGTLVSEGVSAKMLSVMACQQLGKLDKALPRVFRPESARAPITAIPEGRVLMAQKGGTLTGKVMVSHDTAVMKLSNGHSAVMVVMTEGSNDNALELMKNIARAVYDNLA